MQLERDVIEQARIGVACDAYLAAKRATANRERTVAFDEERLAIVGDRVGDVLPSTITRETIEGFQTKPAKKWDGAWRSLRGAAGLPGVRFHDLGHSVVTDLLEAGEPEHVVKAVTGQLSKKMLEHYSHQRLKAKGQMLAHHDRLLLVACLVDRADQTPTG